MTSAHTIVGHAQLSWSGRGEGFPSETRGPAHQNAQARSSLRVLRPAFQKPTPHLAKVPVSRSRRRPSSQYLRGSAPKALVQVTACVGVMSSPPGASTELFPQPTPKGKRGSFSARSRATPTTPSANVESVAEAVKEASAAALRVEAAMAEAIRAAEEMEEGTQRDDTIAAVKRSATELRMSYHQYERLDEEVAEVIAPLQRPSCCDTTTACVSGSCSAVGNAGRSLLQLAVSTFNGLKTPVLFYAFGCLVYGYLEGWTPVDVVYFLTVTSTTVGYGDICPETPLGKLFTCVYALIGLTVVLGALTPFVEFLKGDWRDKLLNLLGCTTANIDDPELTMEQINALINYRRRYAMAALGPVFVLLVGMNLHFFFIREAPPGELAALPYLDELGVDVRIDFLGWIDAFYWSLITMSTIGYGDISPSTNTAKLLAVLYLPMAVIALADFVQDVQLISTRREIRETDFAKVADECLLRDALREDGPPNVSPLRSPSTSLPQLRSCPHR